MPGPTAVALPLDPRTSDIVTALRIGYTIRTIHHRTGLDKEMIRYLGYRAGLTEDETRTRMIPRGQPRSARDRMEDLIAASVKHREPVPDHKDWWKDSGNCRGIDTAMLYPDKEDLSPESDAAKKICRDGCKVREICLEAALERPEPYGIWGGLSTRERRKLLAERAKRQTATAA